MRSGVLVGELLDTGDSWGVLVFKEVLGLRISRFAGLITLIAAERRRSRALPKPVADPCGRRTQVIGRVLYRGLLCPYAENVKPEDRNEDGPKLLLRLFK